jgi:glycosyltransferase involved in cell wall biosynthesis
VEGRALVQQEALACGLPIIVTPNAGGEDLIEEGITGSLIPIRSPQKIAESILNFLDNITTLDERRAECKRKAKEFTWEKYASSILEFNLVQTELRS